MRSSAVLAALGASLAIASPLHKAFHNRDIVWDIITDIVTVTVTEGASSTPPPAAIQTVVISRTVWALPSEATTSSTTSTTSTPEPPPAPTTTSTSEPPPAPAATTQAPAPAPAPAQSTIEEATVQQTAPSSAAPEPATPTDYASTAIAHHNYHRANHSAPDVTWSDSLAASALIVANSCVFAHDMTVNGGGYGQNLAAYGTTASDFDSLDLSSLVADAITNSWYDGEISYVPWGENSPQEASGGPQFLHATQLIWKASTQVGCATVNCPSNTVFQSTDGSPTEPAWYTVCNYGPEGNVLSEFNANISPGFGHPTITATIT